MEVGYSETIVYSLSPAKFLENEVHITADSSNFKLTHYQTIVPVTKLHLIVSNWPTTEISPE
jgi:hypothetical protein